MENILYKRDLHGNVREWRVDVVSNNNLTFSVVTKYGQLKGKLIENVFDTVDSSSRANDIVDSLILRKKCFGYKSLEDVISLDNGYSGSSDKALIIYEIRKRGVTEYITDYLPFYNTTANNSAKPMKCQKFSNNLFKNGMIGQPKVNGVRATIQWRDKNADDLFDTSKVHILSKEGLRYRIKHIEDWFSMFIFNDHDNKELIFDGELYIHNERVTGIGGAARNSKNPLHTKLQFVCFDLAIPDISQLDRIIVLREIFDSVDRQGYYDYNVSVYGGIYNTDVPCSLYEVPVYMLYSRQIASIDDAIAYCDLMISNGFEGAVFRHPNATYCFGQRPKTMIKLKQYNDAEFEILHIDINDSETNIGVSLLYTLKNDINDQTFICSGEGTVSEKRNIFANRDKYIGEMATVKFYERTINDLPFHANVIAIRNYEKQ